MELLKIGTRIRRQREYLGYSREALAERLEITPKFCADIELGVKGMSIATLINISGVLKLSTDYILFGEQPVFDAAPLLQLIQACPKECLPQLETVIKAFVIAVDRDAPK
jgi:transcriptional regulator with XRE-family HTH domain